MFNRKILYIIIIFFLTFSPVLFAQSEEDLDREFLSDTTEEESSDDPEEVSEKPNWDIFGFIESTNQFGISPDNPEIVKLEVRSKLTTTCTFGSFYAKMAADIFLYRMRYGIDDPYHEWGQIEAQELYFGGGNTFQFKIGKQKFSWGTADFFGVTNYFNQLDLREFFTKEEDDLSRGVLALSIKYLIGDFAIEAAVTPTHNPLLMPVGFWALEIPGDDPPIILNDTEYMPADFRNISFAIRGGGTIGGLDFHVSYFNGINSDLILEQELTGDTYAEREIQMSPYFDRRHSIGLDLAFSIEKLSVRAESCFSFNMPTMEKQDPDDLDVLLDYWSTPAFSGGSIDSLLTAIGEEKKGIVKVPHLSYVIGADYNLWGQNGRVLVEWGQGFYLDSADYNETLFAGMLIIMLKDKFLDERLHARLGTILRPIDLPPGFVVLGEVGWDFKNGFSMAAGGYFITGNDDLFFVYFEDKDMAYLKAKFKF